MFRTHVNGQNLLTAELKYLFLLRNKAVSLDLSAAGFVPQAGEKSLWGEKQAQREKNNASGVCCVSAQPQIGVAPHLPPPPMEGVGWHTNLSIFSV